jgi:hypothetical protein
LGIAPHKPIGYNDGRFGGDANDKARAYKTLAWTQGISGASRRR